VLREQTISRAKSAELSRTVTMNLFKDD
jgi:hypothetical protein